MNRSYFCNRDKHKCSDEISFIVRLNKVKCIFNDVVTLSVIIKYSGFDAKILNSMDKVCQMMYEKSWLF